MGSSDKSDLKTKETKAQTKIKDSENIIISKQLSKEIDIKDYESDKNSKLVQDQPTTDEIPKLHRVITSDSSAPDKQNVALDIGDVRLVESQKPVPELAVLVQKIRRKKKQLESSKCHDLLGSEKTLHSSKKDSEIEIVDISSDSDLEDDEFRKIFPKIDTELDFDISELTDEELISSGATSETSSCVMLEDVEMAGPSTTTISLAKLHSSDSSDITQKGGNLDPKINLNEDVIIPVIPQSTTITAIPKTNISIKSISTTNKKTKVVKNQIEVVDLE